MANEFLDFIKKHQDDISLLQERLLQVLREYCNLRIQLKMGRLKQLHLLKQSRHNIALLKSCLSYRTAHRK